MKRTAILLGCILLIAGCCQKKAAVPVQAGIATERYKGVECILYQDANMIEFEDADSLVNISLELLAQSDDVLRLGVLPEMIDQIKDEGVALEIIFPEPIDIKTGFGVSSGIRMLLIPLEGGFGHGPELSSATIFLGRDKYLNGPHVSHKARPYLIRLRKLLELD